MELAFYAPMKSPDHPTPSGDRTIGRSLLAALALAGHSATKVSDLRIFDKAGEERVQDDLFAAAKVEVARILSLPNAANWHAWVTYHNYYKAPDLIGPTACEALEIPYILIEASRARKRLNGPWSRFAQAAEAASDAAHTIFYFTQQDGEALHRDAPIGQHLLHLSPFLPRRDLPAESTRDGPILIVGMMRSSDKLASYALIAETLGRLEDIDWRCDIIGDGPARGEVEQLMRPFGDRVRFLGQQSPQGVLASCQSSSVLFWPGVNEAFGMVYLEAQATGLPVVAQDRPGVRDVVPEPRIALETGATGMADRLRKLLLDKTLRDTEGHANRQGVAQNHLLSAAAYRLNDALQAL